MLIETEPTPNPQTLKFRPGRVVMATGTRDFADADAATVSPLAAALFDQGDVAGVFFGHDFVSVTLAPGVDWHGPARADVLAILLDHFAGNMPLFVPAAGNGIAIPPADAATYPMDPADADIVAQIRELIDTRVRPAVANDGGDIVYRGFDRGVVYLTLQGACAGCPSSTATLKNGIEQLLKYYVPEVSEVRAA